MVRYVLIPTVEYDTPPPLLDAPQSMPKIIATTTTTPKTRPNIFPIVQPVLALLALSAVDDSMTVLLSTADDDGATASAVDEPAGPAAPDDDTACTPLAVNVIAHNTRMNIPSFIFAEKEVVFFFLSERSFERVNVRWVYRCAGKHRQQSIIRSNNTYVKLKKECFLEFDLFRETACFRGLRGDSCSHALQSACRCDRGKTGSVHGMLCARVLCR